MDLNNFEARKDAYWMIVYIYLKKTMGIDIRESFSQSGKVNQMLDDIDLRQFNFSGGFLEFNGKKINLDSFVQIADHESALKEEFLNPNNMHNLTNVKRIKSEMGMFSDYPHFYEIVKEGSPEPYLYATRFSENGDFVISRQKDVFCEYGLNFIAILKPNILGTRFEVYNHGIEARYVKELPKDFLPKQILI